MGLVTLMAYQIPKSPNQGTGGCPYNAVGHPSPLLFSIKECYSKEVPIVKKSLIDPLWPPSQPDGPGGDKRYRVVLHDQESTTKSVLR